jgi:hypothetical protein
MGIHAIGLQTRVPSGINATSDVEVKLTHQLRVSVYSVFKSGSTGVNDVTCPDILRNWQIFVKLSNI